jgi:hypothetical protein
VIKILGMIRRDVKKEPPEVSNQLMKCFSGVLNIGNARMNKSSKNRNYFPWNRAVPGTQQYFPHTGIPKFEPISMSMISKAKWVEEIKKFHHICGWHAGPGCAVVVLDYPENIQQGVPQGSK